jgi:hypothetical protein
MEQSPEFECEELKNLNRNKTFKIDFLRSFAKKVDMVKFWLSRVIIRSFNFEDGKMNK